MIWEKWSLCQERVVSRRSHTIPWGPLFPTQSDASPAQPHQVEVTTGSSGFLCLCSLISKNSSPPFYTSSNASGIPQSMSHGSNKIFTTWTFDPSVVGTFSSYFHLKLLLEFMVPTRLKAIPAASTGFQCCQTLSQPLQTFESCVSWSPPSPPSSSLLPLYNRLRTQSSGLHSALFWHLISRELFPPDPPSFRVKFS